MSDLKEFLENKGMPEQEYEKTYVSVLELGLFFWERGGKEFCWHYIPKLDFDGIVKRANKEIHMSEAQDFLDCLACLGEERVKQLIKELEGKE